jgi:hypothetical protein
MDLININKCFPSYFPPCGFHSNAYFLMASPFLKVWGLGDTDKIKFLTLLGLELRPLGRLAGSRSFNRLPYRGSWILKVLDWNCHSKDLSVAVS